MFRRAALAVTLCLMHAGAEVPLHAVKNVLILTGDDLSLPTIAQIYNEIQTTLKLPDPSAINVYTESLDISRFPSPGYPPEVATWYRQKYRSAKPDIIVTVALPALTFVLDQRENLWQGIPVVAGALTPQQLRGLVLPADVKPVVLTLPYEETLDLALTLFPATRRVVAVYGSAVRDRSDVRQLQDLEAKYRHRLEWTFLTGLPAAELRARLANLPAQTIVIWSIMTADSLGRSFVPAREAVAALTPASSAPVFGVYATFLGSGVVGGVPFDPAAAGRETAEAARFALGLPPSSPLPPPQAGANPPQFDARQLQKWGVPQKRLPRQSQVLFRQPTLLEAHKDLVISTVAVLLILAALIVFLLIERRRLAAAKLKLGGQADELRRLSAALIMAQEEERCRIARELHDDINQRLALLSIEARQIRQQPGAEGIAPRLEELSATVGGLSADVHGLAHGLHPAKLDLLGLLPAVKRHCQEVQRLKGINVELTVGTLPGDLPRDAALCLYRVVQEALANVVRHSGSNRASVDLRTIDGTVAVTIADNGCGFDPDSVCPNRGMGLLSMRERLRLVNGTISIRPRPGAGTEVRATVPAALAMS